MASQTPTDRNSRPVIAAPAVTRGFFARFTVLSGAVRELWIVFGTKLLTLLAYGVMNFTLVLWLSSDLGFDDKQAGYLYSAWSMTMTLCTVAVGSLVDTIGLRKAVLLGASICFLSRGVMAFSPGRGLALAGGLFPLAVGEALMTPVMVAAVRRYSTTAQRSISFSIFYAMMNAGLALAGVLFDAVRKRWGEHGHIVLPGIGVELSTYRTLLLLSFLLTLPGLAIFYFGLRGGVEATEEGVRINPERLPGTGRLTIATILTTLGETLKQTARTFAGLWRQSAFFKFLVFLALVVGVRLITYHMYNTYPKFGIRELGEGAPIGKLWSVNQVLILVLAPLVGALVQRAPAYKMVTWGSAVSAASVFVMALPPEWFRSVANGWVGDCIGHRWLGLQGEVNPYYPMILLFVLILSLGEAFWSPRVYEYTASIAPKGQEASYMSLSYLPFFVAKFFVGAFSGLLLVRYCPEHGPRHSQTLWLILALTTTITPIGLLLFKPYIRVREAGRE